MYMWNTSEGAHSSSGFILRHTVMKYLIISSEEAYYIRGDKCSVLVLWLPILID
jgi:hypothetical protein